MNNNAGLIPRDADEFVVSTKRRSDGESDDVGNLSLSLTGRVAQH